MKNIALFLLLLIGTVACALQESVAERVSGSATSIMATLPSSEITSVPSANSAAAETSAATTSSLSPQVFLWVMDSGEKLGDFYLIKLTVDGQELWRTQFEQSIGLAIDPHDDGVWTATRLYSPEYDGQLIKIDANGHIVQRVIGYETSVFALDLNDGSLWIDLVNEDQIVKLNPQGRETMRLAHRSMSYAMAVDQRDGSLWLASGDNRKIIKLNPQGERVVMQDTPGFFSDAPQQIAVDPTDGTVWHGGFEDVFKLAVDGEILKRVHGFDAPVAVAIDPRDSSVWASDYRANAGTIVKLDQDGNELFRTPLESLPLSIAVHPEDGTVWVGVEGALIKLSPDGFVLTTLPTVHLPKAIVMASVPAPPSTIDQSSSAAINTPLSTAVNGQTSTPRPVTPTPLLAPLDAAEICSAVETIAPDDCEALAQLLYQIDPTLLATLVTEHCTWPRIVCDEDKHIIYLDLSDYRLDTLPPEIATLTTNLQVLDLTNNNLTVLPPEIGQLTELQVLELYGNRLNTLPPEIGQLTNLQSLSLNYNPLDTLPPEIGQLTNLQNLDLWAVNLHMLPPEIGDLTNLQRLSISAQLDLLPPEIGRLTNLRILDVWGNNLSELPPEIGNLSSLNQLDIGGNQLNSLPAEIGNLTNLHYLDLSHNKLTTLPPTIGNLVNLENLVLAYNELQDLPLEIGNLTNLQEFCLYHNLSLMTWSPQVEAVKKQASCTSYEY